jgi:hypothetical protein
MPVMEDVDDIGILYAPDSDRGCGGHVIVA